MADRITAYLARSVLATTLLLPLLAQAQSDQLYRIELLVFSQPSGATAEHWDGIPELAYPDRTRFLTYPGEQAAARVEAAATSIPGDSTVEQAGALPGPVQAATFTTLSAGERRLSNKAAAMQRSGRYRILFHEAWIQPLYSEAQAQPIVLDRSGDGGPWPELQGTVKLYLARYVYLESNLWLNTAGDYLPGSWRMPAPPLAPRSVAPTSASTLSASASAQSSAPGSQNMEPEYPFRHAVLLQQTRRIRSGELVYIDHPLLGVLVSISPLTGGDEAPVE